MSNVETVSQCATLLAKAHSENVPTSIEFVAMLLAQLDEERFVCRDYIETAMGIKA